MTSPAVSAGAFLGGTGSESISTGAATGPDQTSNTSFEEQLQQTVGGETSRGEGGGRRDATASPGNCRSRTEADSSVDRDDEPANDGSLDESGHGEGTELGSSRTVLLGDADEEGDLSSGDTETAVVLVDPQVAAKVEEQRPTGEVPLACWQGVVPQQTESPSDDSEAETESTETEGEVGEDARGVFRGEAHAAFHGRRAEALAHAASRAPLRPTEMAEARSGGIEAHPEASAGGTEDSPGEATRGQAAGPTRTAPEAESRWIARASGLGRRSDADTEPVRIPGVARDERRTFGGAQDSLNPQAPRREGEGDPANTVRRGEIAGLADGRRGLESGSLRSVDISRFRAVSEETVQVSPALLRRAQPQPFGGTGAAQEGSRMDKRFEQNQFAGSPQQKLPGSSGNAEVQLPTNRGTDLARGVAADRSVVAGANQGETLAATAKATGASHATSSTSGSAGVEASGGIARTAEQLLQNLSREVVQFKRYNAESMAVVLKPDSHTEIFLHLVTRNGQVEIQARFERGDFAALNGQWSQLQQALSQQGVRLGNLQDGFNQPQQNQQHATDWGHGQMGQQQQRGNWNGREEQGQPDSFEDLLMVGSMTESVKRTASPRRAATTMRSSALEAWA